jgi:2-dehydro-3-deoxyphosphogluconate aldolase/(4S)-4-hydroxy-2-oxoglutarate aldolase
VHICLTFFGNSIIPIDIEMTIIETIEHHKLVAAIRTETPDEAYKAATACIEGGVRLVEITFSVPDADDVIRRLSADTDALIGAGTVLSISDLRRALNAGASYIVSPHLDEELIKATKKEGAVSIPGACTPTEIYRAYRAGGDIIKLFPFVEIGGLAFLKAVRGPLPFIRYMLSGGLNLENFSEYLAVDPSCILVGSAIMKKKYVNAEDWDSVAVVSRNFVREMNKWRFSKNNPK